MLVSEGEVKRWMQILERLLARYRDHWQWDDLLGEAYAGLAVALSQANERPVQNLATYALTAGLNRARAFLRSPQNEKRAVNRHGNPVLRPLRFSELSFAARGESWHPVEPDFAPRLIAYLDACQAFGAMPAQQRRCVRMLAEGYTQNQIRQMLGISWRVWRRYFGVQKEQNRGGHNPHENQFGYRGVSRAWKSNPPRYNAMIYVHGRQLSLSSWPTVEEAALVYDAAVLCYRDGTGHLNLLPDAVREEQQ